MIAQSKPEFATTSRDICRLLFRHKTKVIGCFTLALCAAIAIIFYWPRQYRSESKLLVRLGRETVTLDPTATTATMTTTIRRAQTLQAAPIPAATLPR